TIFNGTEIPSRSVVKEFHETLPTVKADAEGMLRNTARRTAVRVYETLPGESAMLYEMGIHIVETGDRWHVDVQHMFRRKAVKANVSPSFLRMERVAVHNHLSAAIGGQDANALCVSHAA